MDLGEPEGVVVRYDDVGDVVDDVIDGKYELVQEVYVQEQGTLNDGAEEHCKQVVGAQGQGR